MDTESIYTADSSYYEPSFYESSVYSDESTKKIKKQTLKRPGMYSFKKKIVEGEGDDQEVKYKKITLFDTPHRVNSQMINAITGIPYFNDGGKIKYALGTQQEDDIFKVRFLALVNKIPPVTLCYDSPEQYERHMYCTLNQSIKAKWHEKNKQYKKRMARLTREE